MPAVFLIERTGADAVRAIGSVGSPKAEAPLWIDHPFLNTWIVGLRSRFCGLLTESNRLRWAGLGAFLADFAESFHPKEFWGVRDQG